MKNMMDIGAYGIIGYFLLVIGIIVIRIIAIVIVAGAIATYLGLNGLLWWTTVIVIFLILNSLISSLKG